ncbi:hypothetical protein [Loigolactobacillus iwatensis]|uniref:hypothetical protein n=1 Tax=Loigolactobacillus iwatensis TaxID=1267156 RepID=UPI000F7F9A2F|nr:hypothetical protein [Loigolactobacillus iwatensis]
MTKNKGLVKRYRWLFEALASTVILFIGLFLYRQLGRVLYVQAMLAWSSIWRVIIIYLLILLIWRLSEVLGKMPN